MKYKILFLTAISACLSGCNWPQHAVRTMAREFYSGSDITASRQDHGFKVVCPDTWGFYTEQRLDGPDVESGLMVAIVDYEWSPVVQFNTLKDSAKWTDDLHRLDVELSSRQELQQVQVSEALTSYNKFTGHGLRKVGTSRGRRSEFILFYPDGEMRGKRLLVLLYGEPNAVSLREMDSVIRSVTFESKTKASRRPNQSPEPTAMSVTPPAAQESRQP